MVFKGQEVGRRGMGNTMEHWAIRKGGNTVRQNKFLLVYLFKIGYPPNTKEMAVPAWMTDQTGPTAVTALEPKLSQKMVEPAGITQNQGEGTCSERQILESHQGGKFVEVNVEWYPSTSDMWVQCETCKKWHMLPDESDPVTLPDKW